LSLGPEIAYFVLCFLLIFFLVWIVFSFTNFFFQKTSHRLWVVFLVLFSSLPFSEFLVDSTLFFSLEMPHLIFDQVCFLTIFYLFFKRDLLKKGKEKQKNLFFVFIIGLALSLSHVFINWMLTAILFFWFVFSSSVLKKKNSRSFLLSLFFSSLPMSAYLLWLSWKNEFFRYWLGENQFPALPFKFFLPWLLLFFVSFFFLPALAKKNKPMKERVIFLLFFFIF